MNLTTLLKIAGQHSLSNIKLSEWRSLLLALLLAISIASLMAVLGERIEQTLQRQGSALLGADLVLSNSRPLSDKTLSMAEEMALDHTSVTQIASMANQGDNFVLVSVRALNAPYPSGQITLDKPTQTALPNLGEAWAEKGVFERLKLEPGDKLTLGSKEFVLTRTVIASPDRGRGFISFNPQIIINLDDLKGTELLGSGSRVHYRQLFSGDAQQIAKLETHLQENKQTGEQIKSLKSEEGQQNSALIKASSYLRLGALFALLIAAMTIFLSLRRFTQSQSKRAALLKSLGVSNRQLLLMYLAQLGYAWLLCSFVGVGLAIILEASGLQLLNDLLPQPVPAATFTTYFIGPALGIAIIVTLGLPNLLLLQKSTPTQLFQNQPSPLKWGGKLPYICAFVVLLLFTSSYLNSLWLTLSLTLSLLILGSLLGWLGAHIAQWSSQRLSKHHPLGQMLVSRMQQQQRWYRIQIPVICLLFALLSINLVALNDLLSRWQEQLPENTPDHFLINIQEWEKPEVETLLTAQQIDNQLWPIYRGRLSKVNGQPLAEALTPEQLEQPSLKRELNLTATEQFPDHNELTSGQWNSSQSVSIEQKLASELGLTLGDTVTFDIAGREASAEITSIRSVRWDSFQPNFYYIFSPDILEPYSPSYLTSFYLGDKSAEVSRSLLQQFPTLTLIDVRQILSQLQTLLSKLSLLSSLLMLLTTASGLVLLYVTLTQELEQRRHENALLLTLGASQKQCKQLDRLEMGLIGGISGVLAVIISEASLWPIHQQLLNLSPVLHPILWCLLPILSSGLFILIGHFSHRQQSLSQSYQTLASR